MPFSARSGPLASRVSGATSARRRQSKLALPHAVERQREIVRMHLLNLSSPMPPDARRRRGSRNSGHHQNGERNLSRRDELGGGAHVTGVAGSLAFMQREAFGAKLIDKPLMQNVVADLAVKPRWAP